MPYVEMRDAPNNAANHFYRLHYSSVHLVIASVVDATGQRWYQIKDDQYLSRQEFVPAVALCSIAPEELTPISPDVTDKRLEVSLEKQMLYAYENVLYSVT